MPAGGDFEAICAEVAERLSSSGKFFRGARVILDQSQRTLTAEEMAALVAILEKNGVTPAEPPPPEEGEPPSEPSVAVRGPLRSGQRLVAEGNVLLLGDLHPGAEIRAGGDVVIMGSARGEIAAGLRSGREAAVFAFQMRPSLLRLGDLVARSPGSHTAWRAEIARARDGLIVVEPFTGWQRRKAREARSVKELDADGR